ncbi:Uri superfamily endonuclease [Halalkaliarchaeum sp. AArc-CO]|uniref:GIY-YIG nuclease family protein n=1 Tax=unclassified Halalkaliarchaeum TaxID=2678344 RepID=UPI00217EA2A2|nr:MULTISPECIES: GIY-YIG nuclease family protein [unclassified Halalkaliarchaeum]MDR5673174.1 GIY-YIG nuclease family protein [Halalkaliarchaeum sp. AArc-GB]UWG51871.1 Uri superfamily endonuclease [Halalkaliarchaeum sp. AArc-CO]
MTGRSRTEGKLPSNGTYTLLVDVDDRFETDVGALGEQRFDAPVYCYTGSAFGTGGFSRIDRHRRLAEGESDARHWHVDYLLGHPATSLSAVVKAHGEDVECTVAGRLGDGPIPGFGASDCDCPSHLVSREDFDAARREVQTVHAEAVDAAAVTVERFE